MVTADRVRRERLRRGWTGRGAVAEAQGISNTHWNNFEDYRMSLTPGITAAVARAYGWSMDWPTTRQDSEPENAIPRPERTPAPSELRGKLDLILSRLAEAVETRANVTAVTQADLAGLREAVSALTSAVQVLAGADTEPPPPEPPPPAQPLVDAPHTSRSAPRTGRNATVDRRR